MENLRVLEGSEVFFRGLQHPNLDYTDCSVLCTPTILPAIRISWDENPTFMLISGRAPRSFIHPCASTGGLRPFDTVIIIL